MKNTTKITALFLTLYFLLTAFVGCGGKGDKKSEVVKLGVTGAVYEELWAPTIQKLADEGITLELVQFSDFSLPNNALTAAIYR